MRKIYLALILIAVLCSCNSIKYHELYGITDEFVEDLQTTYESYGLFGGVEKIKYTKDGEYKVTPIGRLIVVRIERYAADDEYENLKDALESHYSGDKRVNRVYRNQGGTVAIDCRN
ncbi:MAG: ABC transporter [Prevotella sp.]|nr:ABC transporter [Prevotella sp.]